MVNVYNKEGIGGTGMNISFDEVLQKIESADDYEIEQIMDAVRKRFEIAFPDWEVVYVWIHSHKNELNNKFERKVKINSSQHHPNIKINFMCLESLFAPPAVKLNTFNLMLRNETNNKKLRRKSELFVVYWA